MKALRDLGWPHLVPAGRLHTSRSTPALKHTDSIKSPQTKQIQINGLNPRRASEGANRAFQSIQTEPFKLIVNSGQQIIISEDFDATKSPPKGLISAPERSDPDVNIRYRTLAPLLSTVELAPQTFLDRPSSEYTCDAEARKPAFDIRKRSAKTYETLADHETTSSLDSLYFEAINITRTEMDALSFEDVSPQEKVDGLRFEFEHRFCETNDSHKQLPGVAAALRDKDDDAEAAGAFIKAPRIKIIRPSVMLDVLPVPYEYRETPHSKSRPDSMISNHSVPSIHDTSRSITPVTAATPSPSLDGPAPELPSATSSLVQPVGHGISASDSIGAGVGGVASSGVTGDVVAALPSCCPAPAASLTDSSLPLNITDGIAALADNLPDLSGAVNTTAGSKIPTALKVPGQPLDQTGSISLPPFPESKLSKKQRAKFKTQKLIRIGRRVVMRKSVLSLVLGRQLAGPTVTILKLVSRGGQVPDAGAVVGTATTMVPNSVPVHLPI